MKRKSKAILLSSIASLAILAGCGENNTLTIDNEVYVQSGKEYIKLNLEPKVFEPGTHKICYAFTTNGTFTFNDGWNSLYTRFPEAPEGYIATEVITASSYRGFTDVVLFTFVNEKTVEAEATYNSSLNVVEYITPGKVVEEIELKK